MRGGERERGRKGEREKGREGERERGREGKGKRKGPGPEGHGETEDNRSGIRVQGSGFRV